MLILPLAAPINKDPVKDNTKLKKLIAPKILKNNDTKNTMVTTLHRALFVLVSDEAAIFEIAEKIIQSAKNNKSKPSKLKAKNKVTIESITKRIVESLLQCASDLEYMFFKYVSFPVIGKK